jgi:HSP20 family molecular chaperone IbpA
MNNKLQKWGFSPIPSGAYSSLVNQIDSLFDNFFEEPLSVFKVPGYPYNIRLEKDNNQVAAHIVEVALAGVSRDRVKVSTKEGRDATYLNIVVDKKEEAGESVYKKISNSSYKLDLALSDHHDVNNVSSELKDGLLVIRVPVINPTKPEPLVRQIEIK